MEKTHSVPNSLHCLANNCFYYRIIKPNIKGQDQKTDTTTKCIIKSVTNEKTEKHASTHFKVIPPQTHKKILVLTDLLVVYANHNSFLLKSF